MQGEHVSGTAKFVFVCYMLTIYACHLSLDWRHKATLCQFVAHSWEERGQTFCQLDWPQPTMAKNSLRSDSTAFLAALKEKS